MFEQLCQREAQVTERSYIKIFEITKKYVKLNLVYGIVANMCFTKAK